MTAKERCFAAMLAQCASAWGLMSGRLPRMLHAASARDAWLPVHRGSDSCPADGDPSRSRSRTCGPGCGGLLGRHRHPCRSTGGPSRRHRLQPGAAGDGDPSPRPLRSRYGWLARPHARHGPAPRPLRADRNLVGDTLLFTALNRIGPRRAGILFALNAPISAVLGWIFLGETLPPAAILGILLTCGGVMLAILFGRRPGQPAVLRP